MAKKETKSLRWVKLDNAAKIYPAARRKNWSNVFRQSATLVENIDTAVLKSALEITVKRFPSIAARLRKGMFWYYLQQVECAPEIREEYSYPLTYMSKSEMRKCAFRVIVYINRIAVEFFHSLTDGTGALIISYVAFALPLWFKKPNPVIFVPCDFVAIAIYLLYINLASNGNWFISFAFPVVGGIGLITCTVITLMHYLQKGKLYILGGAFMALGAFMLLIEFLIKITFNLHFIGWSVYPLVVLLMFGGLLIYLAINKAAREILERKLFF